jgi:mRNA interferase RelE/StbE
MTREILYHRAAARALRRIPEDRKDQIKAAIAGLADQTDVLRHPSVKIMQGNWVNCMRLRVGSYRVIFRITGHPPTEQLEVLEAGPRGDIY